MYKTILELTDQKTTQKHMVGAFNMHNLEMLPSMIKAAEDLNSPIIIQTSVETANYIGHDVIVAVVKMFAENHGVDIALHLDHCRDFEEIKKAIDAGYNSVMYDGSLRPLEENIYISKKVVEYAHPLGVAVEAEIGTIGGTEEGVSVSDKDKMYTDPEQAADFVKQTGCDLLAVAIGTNHGQFKSKAVLNIPLLSEICQKVEVPLVIHGGTGVDENDYPKLLQGGVRKFNVGTEILVAWNSKAKEEFKDSKLNRSVRYNVIPSNNAVYEVVSHKINLFMNK